MNVPLHALGKQNAIWEKRDMKQTHKTPDHCSANFVCYLCHIFWFRHLSTEKLNKKTCDVFRTWYRVWHGVEGNRRPKSSPFRGKLSSQRWRTMWRNTCGKAHYANLGKWTFQARGEGARWAPTRSITPSCVCVCPSNWSNCSGNYSIGDDPRSITSSTKGSRVGLGSLFSTEPLGLKE